MRINNKTLEHLRGSRLGPLGPKSRPPHTRSVPSGPGSRQGQAPTAGVGENWKASGAESGTPRALVRKARGSGLAETRSPSGVLQEAWTPWCGASWPGRPSCRRRASW